MFKILEKESVKMSETALVLDKEPDFEDQAAKKKESYHELKEFQRFGIKKIFGEFLVPLLLIVTIPVASTLLWYICRYYKGSLADFFVDLSITNVLYDMIFDQWSGDLFPIYVITGIQFSYFYFMIISF